MEINHPIIQLLMDIPQGVSPPTFTNQQTHHPLAPRHEKLLLPGHLEGWEDQKKYIKGRCSDQNKKHDSLFKGKIRNSENLNSNQTRVFFFKTLRRCKDLNMVTLEIRRNLSGCATRLWQPPIGQYCPIINRGFEHCSPVQKIWDCHEDFCTQSFAHQACPEDRTGLLSFGDLQKKGATHEGSHKATLW